MTIKEILGHSTVQMTMVYCHSSQESKRKAVQKLEEIFSVPSIVQDFVGRNREEKLRKNDPASL